MPFTVSEPPLTVSESRRLVEGELLTIKEAANFFKISRTQIYNLLDRVLPSVKIGRSRRIPKAALVELAVASLVCPAARD